MTLVWSYLCYLCLYWQREPRSTRKFEFGGHFPCGQKLVNSLIFLLFFIIFISCWRRIFNKGCLVLKKEERECTNCSRKFPSTFLVIQKKENNKREGIIKYKNKYNWKYKGVTISIQIYLKLKRAPNLMFFPPKTKIAIPWSKIGRKHNLKTKNKL